MSILRVQSRNYDRVILGNLCIFKLKFSLEWASWDHQINVRSVVIRSISYQDGQQIGISLSEMIN
jgi:hypothetical protein